MSKEIHVYFLMLLTGFGLSCTNPAPDGLVSGEHDFQIEPGISLQLIASEPLVIDPVAFTFNEHHEMYVVEHRGYPDPAEGGAPPKKEGRIAKLIDVDNDGIYDRRVEFAEGFTYPNGIISWKGGVYVTCAPDIFYLKDTTGDDMADIRKIVLTGFYDTKTAQIRMSHPSLGLDGWIYVTGGLNGGEIFAPEYPDREKVLYHTGDGRFHPETLEFQVTGGQSQFGLTMDPFGRRFGCSNRHPVRHIVIEPHDLDRNPYLLHSETLDNVSKIQEEAVVYPISGAATTADFIPKLIGRSHKGTFTSASGLLIYSDRGLGTIHQGNVFICESAQSLIQCQTMHENGVSFKSEIATDGREFLASKDEWFRPVFLSHGPLPGLYVADMHRKVIDHPAYLPKEIRGDLDFESGRDMGRIYRVVASNLSHQQANDRTGEISSVAEAGTLLLSDWEWQRALAFQILLELKDTSVSGSLREHALNADLAESRCRSLWLLHLLGCLDFPTHLSALQDSSSRVREQAVRIARLSTYDQHEILSALLRLSTDPDMRVRFLTSLALGAWKGNQVLMTLAQIAARDGSDSWSRAAVLSSVGTQIEAFLMTFQQQNDSTDAYRLVMQDLGEMLGNGGSLASCRSLFRDIISPNDRVGWKISTSLGLMKGISARSGQTSPRKKNPWLILQDGFSGSDRLLMTNLLKETVSIALDQNQPASHRNDAVLLLGFVPPDESFPVLEEIIQSDPSRELQIAAIRSLTIQGEKRGASWLLAPDRWPTFTPKIRAIVLSVLFSRFEYIKMLLEAVEEKIVSPTDLSSSDR
ncbi:MAG: HEAT repeat domain-containing protein, partial [Saprospiraceae bacterium]|nr:HEAT repeat domain-containing protein [Saprospiraceae bacterium]